VGIVRRRKQFFFEKKNQKTYDYLIRHGGVISLKVKSFLVLFFKKELLPALPNRPPRASCAASLPGRGIVPAMRVSAPPAMGSKNATL
jgi:hypothetical protein